VDLEQGVLGVAHGGDEHPVGRFQALPDGVSPQPLAGLDPFRARPETARLVELSAELEPALWIGGAAAPSDGIGER
jgi:hypothetical protein